YLSCSIREILKLRLSLYILRTLKLNRGERRMQRTNIIKLISTLLISCLLAISLVLSSSAGVVQRRNPEAGKKKAAKRIGIGAAIGAGAGGLIGGRKCALIGAGAGAGAGTAYHYHKKHQYRKRHRRY